jgi:DNA-directed RNA polymerase subunit K/omega
MRTDADELAAKAGTNRFGLVNLTAGRAKEIQERHGQKGLQRKALAIAMDEVADGELTVPLTAGAAVAAAESITRSAK